MTLKKLNLPTPNGSLLDGRSPRGHMHAQLQRLTEVERVVRVSTRNRFISFSFHQTKLGCVVRMVVDSILPHAKSGPNDHRQDASPFRAYTSYTDTAALLLLGKDRRILILAPNTSKNKAPTSVD